MCESRTNSIPRHQRCAILHAPQQYLWISRAMPGYARPAHPRDLHFGRVLPQRTSEPWIDVFVVKKFEPGHIAESSAFFRSAINRRNLATTGDGFCSCSARMRSPCAIQFRM